MAKRTETVQDLIAELAEPGESVTAWCKRVGYPVRTLTRLLNGETEPRQGSLTLLASKLQLTTGRDDLARVKAAIAASRAAAGK